MNDWKNIKYILPILAILISFYGFLYSKYYYENFGIRVQDFFSIQDYMRANVDNLYGLIVFFGLNYILGFFYSLDSTATHRSAKEEKTKNVSYFINLALSVILFLIFTFIWRAPGRYLAFGFVAMLLWARYFDKILPNSLLKMFVEKSIWLFVTIFVSLPCFFIYLYVYAKYDAISIIESKSPIKKEVKFKEDFSKQTQIDSKNLVIIGSNSQYFFFYDRENKLTHVIPLGSIENVVVKR